MARENLHRSPLRIAMMLIVPFAAIAWWRFGKPLSIGHVAWLAGFAGMLAIRIPHHSRNQKNAVEADAHDVSERVLLGAMWLASMVLPFLVIATPWFDAFDYRLPEIAVWIGVALLVPYLWLFWRSHADLGRNWSPGLEVRTEHELITRGVYARIRNPMYAAIWLGAFAQALLIQNWIGGFAVIPAFAAMWFIRVPREEAMMRERFGAAWDAYVARSGRLAPPMGRRPAS
ncbi:protein-S-isoprenylcysteine O-methyltransferase [Phenylobacterium sp.]|jgi:protein-S-isoprenylcysteine O-methyltransferase Ste14|uniref:protein-S-isoprenylcysteine O-methyltransferase n=1 Tax=Phenylobacterium sp. TaxID=1871053 RepID=UPI0035AF8A2B